MLQRAGLCLIVLSVATGYRLVFDSPGRNSLESQISPDLPPQSEEEEQSSLGLPGFLTAFQNCFQPPQECPNENVTFWLYTRKKPFYPTQLDITRPETLKNMNFDKGKPWKLLIHGYTGHRDYDPNPQLREAFFKRGKFNLISLDYGPLVREPCYISAVGNVPLVANCTAQLLDALITMGIIPLEDLHIVSFSLGTHVSGNIRNYFKSGVISRISALDPAFPLFLFRSKEGKLDSSDAAFVDVIHTNAGNKGMPVSVGHVDFYPNGGYSQLGCAMDDRYGSTSSCNHARAVDFYAESINSDIGFWAVPCNSVVMYNWGWCQADETNQIEMGYYVPQNATGNYYLTTNVEPPFAMGKSVDIKSRRTVKAEDKKPLRKNYPKRVRKQKHKYDRIG